MPRREKVLTGVKEQPHNKRRGRCGNQLKVKAAMLVEGSGSYLRRSGTPKSKDAGSFSLVPLAQPESPSSIGIMNRPLPIHFSKKTVAFVAKFGVSVTLVV